MIDIDAQVSQKNELSQKNSATVKVSTNTEVVPMVIASRKEYMPHTETGQEHFDGRIC